MKIDFFQDTLYFLLFILLFLYLCQESLSSSQLCSHFGSRGGAEQFRDLPGLPAHILAWGRGGGVEGLGVHPPWMYSPTTLQLYSICTDLRVTDGSLRRRWVGGKPWWC